MAKKYDTSGERNEHGLDLTRAAKRLTGDQSFAAMGQFTRDLYEGTRGDINQSVNVERNPGQSNRY